MQTLNRFFFEISKLSLEKYCASMNKPLVRSKCIKLIQNDITYSKEEKYEEILEQDIYSQQLFIPDLTR